MKFNKTVLINTKGILRTAGVVLLIFTISCKSKTESSTDKSDKDSTMQTRSESYSFNPAQPYPYETGILEYKYTGDYEGSEKIFFKDHGFTYRVEENYINKAAAIPEKVSLVFIRTPENFIFYNNNSKKGYSVDSKDTTSSDFEGNLLHDVMSFGVDSTMHRIGYKKAGNENIAGKECQTYTSSDGKSKFCFWNGINIKTDMELGEHFNYTLEATKIDKNASVKDDLFSVPSSVKIMTYPEYVKSETRDKL